MATDSSTQVAVGDFTVTQGADVVGCSAGRFFNTPLDDDEVSSTLTCESGPGEAKSVLSRLVAASKRSSIADRRVRLSCSSPRWGASIGAGSRSAASALCAVRRQAQRIATDPLEPRAKPI